MRPSDVLCFKRGSFVVLPMYHTRLHTRTRTGTTVHKELPCAPTLRNSIRSQSRPAEGGRIHACGKSLRRKRSIHGPVSYENIAPLMRGGEKGETSVNSAYPPVVRSSLRAVLRERAALQLEVRVSEAEDVCVL